MLDGKIFIVIPAYNEEKNVVSVINSVKKYYENIIVVNDCSQDKTSLLARECNIQVIDLEVNKGVGFATRTGCDAAIAQGASILITLDADGQHCADDISNLVTCIRETNSDIVFGYREKDKTMPFHKNMGNRLLTLLNLLLFNVKLKDSLTGFHAIKASSYPKLRWESERYSFITEFAFSIYRENLTYDEALVKTIYLEKKKGMRVQDGLKSILLMFIWRFKFPKSLIKKLNLS